MPENKTQPTDQSVAAYLATRASPEQAQDCQALMAMCERLIGQGPAMWGPSIVGFGAYRYRYDSGREGEAPLAGFAVRGRDLVVYLGCETPVQTGLLARLGKHKMGKSCLYFKRLADLDTAVLEALITAAAAEAQSRHVGGVGGG